MIVTCNDMSYCDCHASCDTLQHVHSATYNTLTSGKENAKTRVRLTAKNALQEATTYNVT